MTKISVTRALTEIKHLSDRIERAANEQFIGVMKGKNSFEVCVSAPSQSIESVSNSFKKNLQAVNDLISRRERLKKAVISSNATTMVTVSGVNMTVAEAIEKKASIAFKQRLLSTVSQQYILSKARVESENVKLSAEINTAVQAAYANDKGKVDEDQYNAVANPRLARNEYSLIDPNNVDSVITSLKNEIDNFLQEVDFVLSESNSRTEIEVV